MKKGICGMMLFALFYASAALASQSGSMVCTVKKSVSSWIKVGQSITIDISRTGISNNGKDYFSRKGIVSLSFPEDFDSITIDRATGNFIDQDSEQSSPQNGKILAVGNCKFK